MELFDLFYSQYPWLYFCLLGLFALLIGSFLNVVIHRLPIMMEKEWQSEYQAYFHPDKETQEQNTYNLFLPGSACPHCGHQITAIENIPVISWLWQKGKCTGCGKRISIRYPLVELFTAALTVIVGVYYEPGWSLLGAIILTWCLVSLTFIDIDKLLLPDQITLPLLWLGLLLNINHTFVTLEDAVIGAIAGYLILWCLYWIFKLLTGKEGMGYGDFKLLAAFGAWLGWQSLPLILLLSSLVGAVIGITLIAIKKHQHEKPIPFGPYLAIAGWISLIWGNAIADWYLGMLG